MTREYAEEVILRLGARSLGVAEGASEGDVLAYGSDGNIAPTAPNGGSVSVTRELFSNIGSPQTVANDDLYSLAWARIDGDVLLDLTDSLLPLVVTTGVYAITANAVCADGSQASGEAFLQFDIYVGSPRVSLGQGFPLKTGGGGSSPAGAITATYYITAGQALGARVEHNAAGSLLFALIASVQRLS